MTEPLSEHVHTNIPVVRDMKRKYGSNLERMSEADAFYLISKISVDLEYGGLYAPSTRLKNIEERIFKEIPTRTDAIALLKLIVNSL